MQIHLIFHVSLLEPAPSRAQLDRITELEDEEEYEVERILNHRGEGPQTEYLVKWKGHGNDENTWEPLNNLTNPQATLAQYYQLTMAPKGRTRRQPCGFIGRATQTTPHHVVERTTEEQLYASSFVNGHPV
jgi:hypothetical protein